MSASTEKKIRKAAREAGDDKKALAAQAEAAKQAKTRRQWTLGTIAVILLIAAILFLNSSFIFTGTKALSIGEKDYSPAELNYYYATQYMAVVNEYGSYASILGLDTSTGLAGLDSQSCPISADGGSWKDYFLNTAKEQLTQIAALYKYAEENGIELTEEELAQIDASFDGMDEFAKSQGYADMDSFFEANYGKGVSSKVIRNCTIDSTLATKVLTEYADALEYSDAELEEEYLSFNGIYDYFDFAYYYVAAQAEEVVGEDGETSSKVTEATLADAKATADAILASYEEQDGDDITNNLSTAASEHVEGAEATLNSLVSGSNLGIYQEWMLQEHESGDATVVENSGNGYYVLAFIGRDDNHYKLAQVRHILIKAVPEEDGTYTSFAKIDAKLKADEILAEFLAGDQSEESFAALAEQYSEDAGSNTNGGLYDQVVKGQMVDKFDQFCFEGHQKGDTAVIYGESSAYAGYHVMYYVGEGDQYSNLIARSSLANEAMAAFTEELSAGYEAKEGFAYRFVG